MKEENKQKDLKVLVLQKLADYLGLTPEDISVDDEFENDLHMHASDLVDFIELLNQSGIDTSKANLNEIVSVADLIQAISQEIYE